jgi:hypothetical protein
MSKNNILKMSREATLFDDESVKEKLTVMLKIDAMDDDSRNPDWADGNIEALEKFLQLGKSYKMTFMVEEIEK